MKDKIHMSFRVTNIRTVLSPITIIMHDREET